MSTEPEISSGSSNTPWLSEVHPAYPRLTKELAVDVAVIGGGIAGLSIAYQLARAGKSVAVVEDGAIGSGETGRTTAHLASALDDRFSRLEQLHGAVGAQLAYLSHKSAIDEIEHIVKDEEIECEFRRLPGYLFSPPGETPELLDQEFETLTRLGIRGVRSLERAPIPGFDTGPCLRFADQGQFHPQKYLIGLAKAVQRHGGRIFEKSHVDDFVDGKLITVKVKDGGQVTASSLVVATNAPILSRVKIPLKQFAYRTYAVSFELPKGEVPVALYWDTADPYHYVRTAGKALIVGGEDHKTGQPHDEGGMERFLKLAEWTRMRFPMVGEVIDRWSGQVMEPADGLAYIGRYKNAGENYFIATGDSGHGMTHGTIAGLLIRDQILGRPNPWEKLYDPERTTLRSIGDVIAENLNVLPQYGKWLTSGDGGSAKDLEPGEGRVFRQGLKKVAVSCDENGHLCALSAVCPHLGGIVVWNETEKTWDCPCHGSRFSAEGKVLNGPANTDLPKARVPSKRPKAKARKS